MKTKFLFIFLCLMANIGMVNAEIVTGDCGENGNNCTYSLDTETGILTISGNGKMQDYSVESYGYPYSKNYSNAPWKEQSITAVIIEEGVTSVGNAAFFGGYNDERYLNWYPYSQIGKTLQSVTIPNSVTSIGSEAFSYCSSLTSVIIGNSVTSIGYGAFEYCSGLTRVHISDLAAWCEIIFTSYESNPLYVAHHLYLNGTEIIDLVIPEGVTSIRDRAFCGCSALVSVTIPNSVTSIEDNAFNGCSSLNRVYCELGAPFSITNIFYSSSPTIYIPNCAFPAFSVAPTWKDMALAPVSVNLAVMNNTGGVVVENCGQMEIEAIPFVGYQFKRWQDGNKDNPRKYTLTQSNRNFIAEFELDKHQITLDFEADHGSIIGDNGKFNYGTEHTIEAVPNYGYHFTQWSDGETENPRTFVLEQDTTFIAEFAPNQYSLTIQYDNTLAEIEAEQGTFDYLSQHTILAKPNYGYHLESWSDGVTENPRTLVLTKDTTLVASFAPNKYQLEVLVDAEMGNIEGAQGEFDYLSEHTIQVIANTGYLFAAWSDGVIDNPRTIALTRDTTITALFELNQMVVSGIVDAEQGIVEGTGNYLYMHSCTLTAVPNYGYHFTQWTDGVTDNPRTIIVSKDTTLTAEFGVDRSGTCGKDDALTWTYNPTTKTLTISGEGALDENMHFGVEAKPQMTTLVIEEGVTIIGAEAFSNCESLTTIYLPSTLKKIDERAFYNGLNVAAIYNSRERPGQLQANTFEGVSKFDCTLFVPEGSVEMYKSASSDWKEFFFVETFNPELPQEEQFTIAYLDQDGILLDSESAKLNLPAAPEIAGFTFLGWQPVANVIEDKLIEIQAVYEADSPSSVSEVVTNPANPAQKLIRQGNVYILRDSKTYTLTGQEVK